MPNHRCVSLQPAQNMQTVALVPFLVHTKGAQYRLLADHLRARNNPLHTPAFCFSLPKGLAALALTISQCIFLAKRFEICGSFMSFLLDEEKEK